MLEKLRPETFTFLEADNGQTACSLALAERPDLVFMDVNMPQMSGKDALQQLRGQAVTRSIPIIMVTTWDEQEQIRACQALGSTAFLRKPVKLLELQGVLAEIFGPPAS
jgi:CheY-like chemotaxis protein